MLTHLRIRNFKCFDEVDIELGNRVVFIGPNNSGKTAAFQALALWELGVRRWNEKRRGREPGIKRPGVSINRRDLVSIPVPDANFLWRDLHVRDVRRENGRPDTRNIRIDITVTGVSQGAEWQCGLEFDYANDESLYCRPLRLSGAKDPDRMLVPEQAASARVAFLPPMSGLTDREFQKQPGEIAFLIGQGRTAEVLRNLCYQIAETPAWAELARRLVSLFGIALEKPEFVAERSEIQMRYRDSSQVRLDLSSAGRGVQQTLLLLAYMLANPGAVLLLDEPDAHLEILRQRQIYQTLAELAKANGSQIIAASHSEVVLNEAAERDVVVAFVGKPHRIDDRGSHVAKALKLIGFQDYYSAERRGWVLYLEGSTDLEILRRLAARLGHPCAEALSAPFLHTVENQPQKAREHFHGVLEAKPDLAGFLLCDRLDRQLQQSSVLKERMWRRREIENYICQPETLTAYAASIADQQPLFGEQYRETMRRQIEALIPPVALRDPGDPYWTNVKASDDFLDRLFEAFFKALRLPNLMRKSNYHELAGFVPLELIDPEVIEVLDDIHATSQRARPLG